jgi:hypothetical protein
MIKKEPLESELKTKRSVMLGCRFPLLHLRNSPLMERGRGVGQVFDTGRRFKRPTVRGIPPTHLQCEF